MLDTFRIGTEGERGFYSWQLITSKTSNEKEEAMKEKTRLFSVLFAGIAILFSPVITVSTSVAEAAALRSYLSVVLMPSSTHSNGEGIDRRSIYGTNNKIFV